MPAVLRYMILVLFVLNTSLCFGQFQLVRTLINGTSYKTKDHTVRMKAGEGDVLLEFDLVKGDSVNYEYRLNGLETKWIASSYPVARYQGLSGGNYIFQIRAKANNRQIAQAEVRIVKDNAFWNEWWFIPSLVVYVLTIIGVGIYLFLLYDFRQKLRMQNVRNQIAADLHDEVGSNLNSIAIFVEILRKNAPKDMLPILEKIIENSKESVTLMQDTVWTINPKNDSIYKLFDRMNSFASQLLAGKDIAFDFKVDADLRKVSFTMDQRKSVYLIFKEAINNIVKHAEATKVQVEVNWLKDTLQIVIEDNGKGFDTTDRHEGNGLFNFQERAKESDIGFTIESEKKTGTKIRMLLEP